jgi:hypothetical protein
LLNESLEEPGPAQDGSNGLGTMPELQSSGAGLEQQRREHEEVVATYQRQLDVRSSATKPLELSHCGHPSESATEH